MRQMNRPRERFNNAEAFWRAKSSRCPSEGGRYINHTRGFHPCAEDWAYANRTERAKMLTPPPSDEDRKRPDLEQFTNNK